MIQAKIGLNCPSGFRGKDFRKSLQSDDGRQVMAISHTGELKKQHEAMYPSDKVEVITLEDICSP
jgi:hypothetical protein